MDNVSYFFHGCDKVPNRKNLREEKVILAQNFSTSWQGSYEGVILSMAVGVCG